MIIPLFDIDWTLLKGGNKAHGDALNFALHQIYRLPTASIQDIKAEGLIDTSILISVAMQYGFSKEKAVHLIPEALSAVESYYVEHSTEGEYITLPGVIPLLQKIKDKRIPIGLLTGNIEPVAWHKLKYAGINEFFAFGAFGNMAFERPNLIPIAIKQAEKKIQKQLLPSDFVIIGDSPRDVLSAKKEGVKSVAVATGLFSVQTLHRIHPTLLLSSLANSDTLLSLLS